jgi:hypothetical protein
VVELGVLFGLMVGFVAFLAVTLLRRGNRATENADGLLVEQARRVQAQRDRSTYGSVAVHNSLPTLRGDHRF